jgi:hypothetical protein
MRKRSGDDSIPELVRLARLEVRGLRFDHRSGARLAVDWKTVDLVVARESLDLVSVNSRCLATEVPDSRTRLALN